VHGPTLHPHRGEESYRDHHEDGGEPRFTWPENNVVDVEGMARDAFGRIDEIHNDSIDNDGEACMDEGNIEGDTLWNEENFQYLVRESMEKVFEGSSQNRL